MSSSRPERWYQCVSFPGRVTEHPDPETQREIANQMPRGAGLAQGLEPHLLDLSCDDCPCPVPHGRSWRCVTAGIAPV
ncbi:hypothetical protein SKAU_G00030960 [Synaphobranchus kaupii]|uniref:Uncharacterized protein n=1 Tax=Synaphobranchus kaupii TaxID=118154 RepID=A0A9Q1JE43_SYNKA|nr:hypothetical protein SKAU_G00030960 [Synaphobranchus kaupii]